MDDSPKVLSVFSGAGGLDLGLECAGFEIVAANELDRVARETLQKNRPHVRQLRPHDIVDLANDVRPEDIGLGVRELDVLAGGPPCQPFSKAAQWSANGTLGLEDERTDCVSAFLTLVETFLPRVVLIENVPGFVQGRTSALHAIVETIEGINHRRRTDYVVHATILDAVDYGVPQRRRRAIVVILREGGDFKWPRPSHEGKPVRAFDAIGDLQLRRIPKPGGRWTGLLPSIPEGANYQWHTSMGGGVPLFGYRTKFWSFLLKLAKDEPAWTLPAQPGPSTGPFHWANRPLAARELLRLQSFPRSWKIAGGDRERIRQIGNATPPLLAERIGRALGEQVFGLRYRSRPRLHIARKRIIPEAEPVQDVASRYLSLEGDHPPHPGTGLGPQPRPVAESQAQTA